MRTLSLSAGRYPALTDRALSGLLTSKLSDTCKVSDSEYNHSACPLPQTLEHVCLNHEPVIVTRKHLPPVAVMSLEDYQALTETAYLLRSPNNARRLLESIEELERGGGEEGELLDCYR